MNIRDVELRTGLERANIRYYEKEGLVSPLRQANGYRDYSDEDVEILLRIKLLRQLNISITDIKGLQTNEVALQEVIRKRLAGLNQERAQLAREEKVCKTIQADGVEYSKLEAQRYLDQLKELKRTGWGTIPGGATDVATWNLSQDVLPPDLRPVLRLLARIMEWTVYGILWLTLYYRVFQAPLVWNGNGKVLLLHWIMITMVWILLEPLQMACFGTTMGKAIIGMQVYTIDGRKLDLSDAWSRLWKVITLGACIPNWNRYWSRMRYGDYWPYNMDKGFPWDEEYPYSFKDEKPWRGPAVFFCTMGLILLGSFVFTDARKVDHRGPMTVKEFAENYNKYVKMEGQTAEYQLNPQGQWVKSSNTTAYIYAFDGSWSTESRFPQLVYTQEDGYITGISFEIHHRGEADETIPGGGRMIKNLVMAYAVPYVGHQSSDLVKAEIEQNYMHSHTMQLGDLEISWKIQTTGYTYNEAIGNFQAMNYGSGFEYAYHMTFQIRSAAEGLP